MTLATAPETLPPPLPPNSPAIVRVDSVSVRFEKLIAVRNVSFTLGTGDLLGLIGPNGAGKSTLLRCIAGLQPLSRGQIHILDEPVAPGLPALNNIGFTPDTPPFYEEMTVRQFLTFIAMAYGLSRAEGNDRIDFWLEKVWLTEKSDQKIKGLSRGMRQRIGIARTLIPNPAVVLLDEPASGLDPAGRAQFRQLLIDLRQQGKVLIVSSHILADMEEYCTHAAIMAKGQMIRFGTVREVSDHNQTQWQRYTISLAAPRNALDELLRGIEGVTVLQASEERAIVGFGAGRESGAALLSELLARKLQVCAFTPEAIGLEDAYIRSGVQQVD